MKTKSSPTSLNRRAFVCRGLAALATVSIVPGYVLGLRGQTPPSRRLNLAALGMGGRGGQIAGMFRSQNILAVCDADARQAENGRKHYGAAPFYQDYRRLLDDHGKSLDGVVIASADNTHAMLATAAMERGKHVFCEKPLTRTIGEAWALRALAEQQKVITQMGNQGHSSDRIRDVCEWIWDGAIGRVHTVHACCGSNYSRIEQLPLLAERPPVPPELNWDLWVGPAPLQPYAPMYLRGKWRGWSAFGCGVIGDWVCHVVDPAFWALDLGSPKTLLAEVRDFDPARHSATFPPGTKITYEFPGKGSRGPVKLIWYDGLERPPHLPELGGGNAVPGTGAMIVGDGGVIMHGSHGAGNAQILPEEKMAAYKRPVQKLRRVRGSHADDWFDAIREGRPAGSDFGYGAALTEIALLGVIALRFPGQRLEWDAAAMRFRNSSGANRFVNPQARNLTT
ncbi:MAG: Gfo/Idh/MocA family oxidoreductase [Verrucomicrobia bacterium]|nr:Gfo/Idh/MocA family oxidoreductase [Verrucomicrobiota bacterium]